MQESAGAGSDVDVPGMDRRSVLASIGALGVGSSFGTVRAGESADQSATGRTVYVGSFGPLWAIDADSGEPYWSFEPETRSDMRSPPTIVDGTVYVGSMGGVSSGVYAVDAATGSLQWKFTEPEDWVRASPSVVDGTVYAGSRDGTLYALDAATGDSEWRFSEPTKILRAPHVAGDTVYVGSMDGALYAVSADSGEERWRFTDPGGPVYGSPTVVDGNVFFTSVSAEDWPSTIHALDSETGDTVLEIAVEPALWDNAPTVADGVVYVGSGNTTTDGPDGTLYAIDGGDCEILWTMAETDGAFGGAPTVADGTVYVGSTGTHDQNYTNSALYAVDSSTGEVEWTYDDFSGNVNASPTVLDGTVYIGNEGSEAQSYENSALHAVDAATGDLRWTFDEPYNQVSSATVVRDPSAGHSVDSRVRLASLGHHHDRRQVSIDLEEGISDEHCDTASAAPNNPSSESGGSDDPLWQDPVVLGLIAMGALIAIAVRLSNQKRREE